MSLFSDINKSSGAGLAEAVTEGLSDGLPEAPDDWLLDGPADGLGFALGSVATGVAVCAPVTVAAPPNTPGEPPVAGVVVVTVSPGDDGEGLQPVGHGAVPQP